MYQEISVADPDPEGEEPIDVIALFEKGRMRPVRFRWKERVYKIVKVTGPSGIGIFDRRLAERGGTVSAATFRGGRRSLQLFRAFV